MADDDSLALWLAGDVMTGRGIDQVLQHPGDPALHEAHVHDARDYVRLAEAVNGPIPAPVPDEHPWGDALATMARHADAPRIVNLETAITRAGEPWPGKGVHYRMHPANIGCLRAARLDAVALANNHVLDWGRRGLHDTLQTLRGVGLAFAGAGADADEAWAPARLALRGRAKAADARLLLFSCALASSGVPPDWAAGPGRPGVALLPDSPAAATRRLAAEIARRRGPTDRVVLSIHWGGNWGLDVPAAHRELAHRLIDAGAVDLVHGHSSHHALPVELYRGRLILYGCGDLINDYEGIEAPGRLRSDVDCLYAVALDTADGRLRRLDVWPFRRRRFGLVAADAGAHDGLGEVYAAAPPLGPQPARPRSPQAGAAWTLTP